jgi:hypothetical protein
VALSGESPVGKDQRGVVLGCGPEAVVGGVVALVLGAFGAQRAEGGGVVAALGGEVAAEAEHVRPRGQPQIGQSRESAKAQADGDEAAGVLTDGQFGELVGGVMRRSRVPVHSAALVAYLAT